MHTFLADKKRALPNCHSCMDVDQTPMHIIDKPLECPVCMDELDEKAKPLLCGHWVHRSCVVQSGKAQCPICRRHVYMSAIERRACAAYKHRYTFCHDTTTRELPENGLFSSGLGGLRGLYALRTYVNDVFYIWRQIITTTPT